MHDVFDEYPPLVSSQSVLGVMTFYSQKTWKLPQFNKVHDLQKSANTNLKSAICSFIFNVALDIEVGEERNQNQNIEQLKIKKIWRVAAW